MMMIMKYDIMRKLRSYQLYDLFLDPLEANNLFDGKAYSKKRPIVTGELLRLFNFHNSSLHRAVEEFFGPFIQEEFEKGYQGPEYPTKMWSHYYKVSEIPLFSRDKLNAELRFHKFGLSHKKLQILIRY